jgi:hypothetical protein
MGMFYAPNYIYMFEVSMHDPTIYEKVASDLKDRWWECNNNIKAKLNLWRN